MGAEAVTALQFALGAVLVLVVMYDVFQSVVVPRYTPRAYRLAPEVTRGLWTFWRMAARGIRSNQHREDFLAAFAPLGLLVMMLVWTVVLILGYGLLLLAMHEQVRPEPQDLGTALYLSAVAFFTLGFGDLVATGGGARFVVIVASASGLALVAMVITVIFNLHGSFHRREALVLTLDARAGTPPSGLTLLETYSRLRMMDDLPNTFLTWEQWIAEVLETHRAYPLLPYFRSSREAQSWVSSLGAILDASTLLLTTVQGGPFGAAEMVHRLGCYAVDELNRNYRMPRCKQEVGISRLEFDDARQRLEAAGFELRPPVESWRSFSRVRSEYAGQLNLLARQFAIPPAQWVGDRSTLPHIRHGSATEIGVLGQDCSHAADILEVTPQSAGCARCIAMDERWVHLRICRTCGHVGCCDSSPNKHATAHFHETRHPVMQSFEPGEDWLWCYVDEVMLAEAEG